jgi:undecaprenyl-diphosphatase
VVVSEKLLGLTLLLMLHIGTMFAVIVHFWRQWRSAYFPTARTFQVFASQSSPDY